MAEVTINNSPVHSDSILTAVYGEEGPHWARFHTGTDFAPYGDTAPRPTLYSVCTGEVVSTPTDNTLGIQAVIRDTATNNYWRYCHMTARYVQIGDQVTTSSTIGQMGDTGNVTRSTSSFRI